MKILGIESSCDETAAAIVEDGHRLLSNVVHSQIDIHAVYGGVVPEVAARSHIEVINPVIQKALSDAAVTWDDIDAIAVTYAPGLIGSLLVGTLAARTLALTKNKPLYPIHHVEAHVYANFIDEQAEHLTLTLPKSQPRFPLLALIVSGGHSQLVLFHDHGDYQLLGQTQDDAVGEAFDKVAKIIGLPYPGGPSIAQAALKGSPTEYSLPKAKMKGAYDFSFSGLKTAVLRAVQREVCVDTTFPSSELAGLLNDVQRANFAASFQRTAIETLIDKTEQAFRDHSPASVVIAGGVAANAELRTLLSKRLPIPVEYAPMALCTDNAAMIAALGYYQAQQLPSTPVEDILVIPSLSMSKTAWRPIKS
ncbi:MAG TPA: tRNA (adenosine(37)-N6)-threonylcarbamoyltransferase complex transferase subunit TsaD [Candidatus Saccharimonadaceae bacterium]|nr:tRNA (adenosine(37)-N6)-threonylcarbamoyltransferase complex transferase subunit TsaD [Candidatus Saccharimonadaceae bacterium]